MPSFVLIMQGGLQATAAQKHSPNQTSPDAHAQSSVEPESKLAEEVRALKVGQQLLAEEQEQLAQAAAKSEKQRSKKQKQKAKKQQQHKQQHEQQQQQQEAEQQQEVMPCASQQDATQSVPHSRPTEQTQLLLSGTGHIVAEGLADLPNSCDRANDRLHRLLCCPITQVTPPSLSLLCCHQSHIPSLCIMFTLHPALRDNACDSKPPVH